MPYVYFTTSPHLKAMDRLSNCGCIQPIRIVDLSCVRREKGTRPASNDSHGRGAVAPECRVPSPKRVALSKPDLQSCQGAIVHEPNAVATPRAAVPPLRKSGPRGTGPLRAATTGTGHGAGNTAAYDAVRRTRQIPKGRAAHAICWFGDYHQSRAPK